MKAPIGEGPGAGILIRFLVPGLRIGPAGKLGHGWGAALEW